MNTGNEIRRYILEATADMTDAEYASFMHLLAEWAEEKAEMMEERLSYSDHQAER